MRTPIGPIHWPFIDSIDLICQSRCCHRCLCNCSSCSSFVQRIFHSLLPFGAILVPNYHVQMAPCNWPTHYMATCITIVKHLLNINHTKKMYIFTKNQKNDVGNRFSLIHIRTFLPSLTSLKLSEVVSMISTNGRRVYQIPWLKWTGIWVFSVFFFCWFDFQETRRCCCWMVESRGRLC